MQKVIKRDGRRAEYDRNKIISAIQKANAEVDAHEQISEEKIYSILASIENRGAEEMAVEDIQDIIEQKLMAKKSLYSPKLTLFIVTTENWFVKPIRQTTLF